MTTNDSLGNVDLDDIVPITKAAASLSELVRKARTQKQPIVVTQKGFASAVLLGVDAYKELLEAARRGEEPAAQP